MPIRILIVALMILSGCTLRGFRPPPGMDYEYKNAERSVTVDDVRQALTACGARREWNWSTVPPGTEQTYEQRYTADILVDECMFNQGYYLESGLGGLCTISAYNILSICRYVPARPRNSYYGHPVIRSNLKCSFGDVVNAECIK